ncbi:hypothetical protein PGB90_003065 [Kerria lacca]
MVTDVDDSSWACAPVSPLNSCIRSRLFLSADMNWSGIVVIAFTASNNFTDSFDDVADSVEIGGGEVWKPALFSVLGLYSGPSSSSSSMSKASFNSLTEIVIFSCSMAV